MKLTTTHIAVLLFIAATVMGCRGQKSEKPPVMPQQNMAFQERFNAQQENPFFEDNRSMRMPVEGTISRGNMRDNPTVYEGVDDEGEYVDEIPMEVTKSFLYRGKERYDIFCQACHGGTGDGQGIIMEGQYGYVPAPTFHRGASYDMPEGELYSAIANGIRSMPSYGSQIPVEDRWAIVAYIRALQQSQNASEEDMGRFDVDLADLQAEYEAEQARQEALAEEAGEEEDVEDISVDRGEALYTQYACNTCHSVDGTQLVGPTFEGLYGSERTFTDGSTAEADEEYLYESIVAPGERVTEGYDNVMQAYDYLSEDEIQSLIEFIKAQSDN